MIKAILITTSLVCSTFLFAQDKESNFKMCEQGSTYPYYNSKVTYQGSFWEIKQQYTTDYPLNKFQKLKNNSGILTIQFKINCKGEIGDFSLQQCDLNYQPIVLDEKITTYFLENTQKLKKWIPGQDEDGNEVNSHKFFSFRIKEGALLEILPK
jgi:hypothetical protein